MVLRLKSGYACHKIDSMIILHWHRCLPFRLQQSKNWEKLSPHHHEKASRLREKHIPFAERSGGATCNGQDVHASASETSNRRAFPLGPMSGITCKCVLAHGQKILESRR